MLSVRVLKVQTHSHRPVGRHQTAVLQSRWARGLGCSPLRNDQFYEDLQDLLKLTPKNDVLFTIGNWNAKVGSQEILGVTAKIGLGVQHEAGIPKSFAKRTHWSQQTPSSNNTRDDPVHGHQQMVNTELRLIILLQLKMRELYTVSKNKKWN